MPLFLSRNILPLGLLVDSLSIVFAIVARGLNVVVLFIFYFSLFFFHFHSLAWHPHAFLVTLAHEHTHAVRILWQIKFPLYVLVFVRCNSASIVLVCDCTNSLCASRAFFSHVAHDCCSTRACILRLFARVFFFSRSRHDIVADITSSFLFMFIFSHLSITADDAVARANNEENNKKTVR